MIKFFCAYCHEEVKELTADNIVRMPDATEPAIRHLDLNICRWNLQLRIERIEAAMERENGS